MISGRKNEWALILMGSPGTCFTSPVSTLRLPTLPHWWQVGTTGALVNPSKNVPFITGQGSHCVANSLIFGHMAKMYVTWSFFLSVDWTHNLNVRILNKHLYPSFHQAAQRTTLHALSDRYVLSFLWTVNGFMKHWALFIVAYNS